MGVSNKFLDGLERSLWTVAEATGAVGIVAGYQSLPLADIPEGYLPLAVIVVGGILAGIKSAVAQKFGNETAATLPASVEPVPQGEVVALPVVEAAPVNGVVDEDGDGRDDNTGRFVPKI